MPFKVAAVHKPSCYITFLQSFSSPLKKTGMSATVLYSCVIVPFSFRQSLSWVDTYCEM